MATICAKSSHLMTDPEVGKADHGFSTFNNRISQEACRFWSKVKNSRSIIGNKSMPSRFSLGLAVVAGLLLAPQAYATTFSFTYTSPDGLSGSVNVSGTQSSSGTFDITSGTDTVTGGSGLVGVFTLFQNASYPTAVNSPSGYFIYDNLLTSNLNPFVDNSGLLFISGSSEVNVYSNGPDSYTHYDNTGFNDSIIVSALRTCKKPTELV